MLPPIFRTPDFSKLPIFRTNYWFRWQEFTLDFSNLEDLGNNEKLGLVTLQIITSGESVFTNFLLQRLLETTMTLLHN